MKIDTNTLFEIEAEAFNIMTGHMAPGKDVSASAQSIPYEARLAIWEMWVKQHSEIIFAMKKAFEMVIQE